MKNFAVALLFAIISVSTISAQSGRRITATPTPTPTVAENETEYSESKPRKQYNTPIQPTFRSATAKNDAPAQEQNPDSDSEDEIVKIETSLITIPVSVFDRNGLYIPNLRRSDFKIFENGNEQEIAYFGTTDKPFTVVLLLDTSLSTSYKIEEIQTAAIAFIDQLEPQDSVMVIEFDGNINVLTEFTKDRQKIYKAIGNADFGFGTSLYDSVNVSLKKYLKKIEGRKAIVLFTDGVDTTSTKAGYDSTIREAEEADTLIFPIYYNTYFQNRNNGIWLPGGGSQIGTRPQDYALGKKYLEELADSTGGRVFRPEATEGGLTAAFEGIAEELRRQYNIGYYPTEEGKAGQRKTIKVRVNRPNLIIRSRDSYVVGAESTKATPNATKSQFADR